MSDLEYSISGGTVTSNHVVDLVQELRDAGMPDSCLKFVETAVSKVQSTYEEREEQIKRDLNNELRRSRRQSNERGSTPAERAAAALPALGLAIAAEEKVFRSLMQAYYESIEDGTISVSVEACGVLYASQVRKLQQLCPFISSELWKGANVLPASATAEALPFNLLLLQAGMTPAPKGDDEIAYFMALPPAAVAAVYRGTSFRKWSRLVGNKCDKLRIQSQKAMSKHSSFWSKHYRDSGVSGADVDRLVPTGRTSSRPTIKTSQTSRGVPGDKLRALGEPGVGSADNAQFYLSAKHGDEECMVVNTVFNNAAAIVPAKHSGFDVRPKWLPLRQMEEDDAFAKMYKLSSTTLTLVASARGDPFASIDASYTGKLDHFATEEELYTQHQLVERLRGLSAVAELALSMPNKLGASPVSIRNLQALGETVKFWWTADFLDRSAMQQNPMHDEASAPVNLATGCVEDNPGTTSGMLGYLQKLCTERKKHRERSMQQAPGYAEQRQIILDELMLVMEELHNIEAAGDAPIHAHPSSTLPASKYELQLLRADALARSLSELDHRDAVGDSEVVVDYGCGGGGGAVPDAVPTTPFEKHEAAERRASVAAGIPVAQSPGAEMRKVVGDLDNISTYLDQVIENGSVDECKHAARAVAESMDGTVSRLRAAERSHADAPPVPEPLQAPLSPLSTPRVLTFDDTEDTGRLGLG